MFPIASVIYGVPLGANKGRFEGVAGAISLESSAGFDPSAFGIEVIEIAEEAEYTELSVMTVPVSESIKDKFVEQYRNLDPALQELIDQLGPPRSFLLWHI